MFWWYLWKRTDVRFRAVGKSFRREPAGGLQGGETMKEGVQIRSGSRTGKQNSRHGRRSGRRIRSARMLFLCVVITVITMACLSGFTGAGVSRVSPSRTYEVITVQKNDTLWEIAQSLYPGEDVRAAVQEIMQVNGLKCERIYAGQRIAVPDAGR